MEVDFCPVLCVLEVPVLQAFRGISHFVWFSLQRLSEESTKLNVSGDSSAGYDWRHHLEVDKAAREREEVILKQ